MEKVTYRPNRGNSCNNQNGLLSVYFSSFFVKMVFLIMSFFLFYNIFRSINITAQKLEILDTAEAEVTALRVKNLKLNLRLDEMKKISFLEVEARDRLNFAGNGETVFVIPENLLKKSEEDIQLLLSDATTLEDQSVMDIWMAWL